MVFHRSLRNSKSSQVSMTPLSILANLNNAVVLIVSPRSLISKSFNLCTNPLVTVQRAPITIGITVPPVFFNSQARSRYLSFILLSFNFTLWFARSLCSSFSWTDSGLCIFHLFIWSNISFLHSSQWITLPTQSCLVSYSFSANLLHSFIRRLILSSLSPHNLHLLFCCVLSILVLIWLVLMGLFCAAIRRDSVSL